MRTWVGRAGRLRSAFDMHRGDPYLRGRASQALGGALLADGLVGLENPLRRRKDKNPGIVGALLVLAIGLALVFPLASLLRGSHAYEGGSLVDGVVSEVSVANRNGGSRSTCTLSVQYIVEGATYTVDSGSSSSSFCDDQGVQVPVSYQPEQPAAGRPQFAEDEWVYRGVLFVGYALVALGCVCTLVRTAEILIGISLLYKGWRLVRRSPARPTADLLSELQEAWSGEPSDDMHLSGHRR